MTSVPRKPQPSEMAPSRLINNDTIVGTELGNIIDPELFHDPFDGSCQMTYLSGLSGIDNHHKSRPWTCYVVSINPTSGLPQGRPQQLADNHFDFLKAFLQGPEWGYCADEGRSTFYTAVDAQGKSYVARRAYSREQGQWLPAERLTQPSDKGNVVVATASRYKKSSIQVLYGNLRNDDHRWFWFDTGSLADVRPIPHKISVGVQPPRWVEPREADGPCDLIFSAPDDSTAQEELFRYDVVEGTVHRLTEDTGNKTIPETFFAPDYGNDRIYVAALTDADNGSDHPTKLNIYRQTSTDPFATLKCVRTLEIPERARKQGYTFFGCIEPIVTKTKSYITVRVAKDDSLLPDNNDTQFWIMSIDGSREWQVSQHANLGGMDQEILVGTEEVFFYYNVYTPTTWTARMHLCHTGIRVNDEQ